MYKLRSAPNLLTGLSFYLLISQLISAAPGQGTMSLDLLTPGDAGYQVTPDVYCVDIHIDTVPTDMWTASGMRGITLNNATFVYQPDDPNTNGPDLLNPGLAHRFTTFFSKPRSRNGSSRFTNAGAGVAGAYQPISPFPIATPTEVNVVWVGGPPEDYFAIDGCIARVAIHAEGFSLTGMNATPLDQVPPEATVLYVSSPLQPGDLPGTVFATSDIPQLHGFDWAIWYVPEPPIALSLLLLGCLVRRR